LNTIMSKPVRTVIAGALLGALALSFATVSSADDSTPVPQVKVKYADLDPSTSQGADALYVRIHHAAENVCWRMYDSIEVYKANKDACMKKAIADAVTKVNQPSLSAVFASKYGVSAPVVLASATTR